MSDEEKQIPAAIPQEEALDTAKMIIERDRDILERLADSDREA